jgi:two-component system cell cycle sensor histidine kinase/response regulator CckA
MSHPRTGTILLVDDEDGIRVALRRQLIIRGHTVLEASHGREALEVVRMRRGNLDLVLSDVVMPEMNGTEFAAVIGEEYPGLPVILMSAHSPAGLMPVGTKGRRVPLLQKPFASGQVEELIEIALEMPDRPKRESPAPATLSVLSRSQPTRSADP